MNHKVLIYFPGGLGDLMSCMPAFYALKERFKDSSFILLSNSPLSINSISAYQDLFPRNTFSEIILYNPNLGKIENFVAVVKKIKELSPNLVVNFVLRNSLFSAARDYIFFRLFASKIIWGFGYLKPIISSNKDFPKFWEPQYLRVMRLLSKHLSSQLGVQVGKFNLSAEDLREGSEFIAEIGDKPHIGISLGGKYDVQQWGDEKWGAVIDLIVAKFPDLFIVAIGSEAEFSRCAVITRKFGNRVINLCGKHRPKASLAAIKKALIFLGQDSGPMHLAASINIPSILVHSARTRPGEWFPVGFESHKIFYRQTPCFGCYKEVCIDKKKYCMELISVAEVANAAIEMISSRMRDTHE